MRRCVVVVKISEEFKVGNDIVPYLNDILLAASRFLSLITSV